MTSRELTPFGRQTVEDRYLLPDEATPEDMFMRVAVAYGNNEGHVDRLYGYMTRQWFMPSTPILSNGGSTRGLPISCYLNSVEDSLKGIASVWDENIALASNGGGIGTSWSDVRGVGAEINRAGESSGIIPFIKVMDSMTLAISQGSLRRGSAAVYLDVSHPEIFEFVDLRRHTGDANRRALNLHHAVVIDDFFMHAVEKGLPYDLWCPHKKSIVETISARELWIKILTTRLETGEPYIMWYDTVNEARPANYPEVTQSNLCSEITLHTNARNTAVCCLSSLNLEYFDEWEGNYEFIKDVMYFLDNVMSDFIAKSNILDGLDKARATAYDERSVGLGVMGFHSFLQKMNVPIEGAMATSWNKRIFKMIKSLSRSASLEIGEERGSPLFAHGGHRFAHRTAIAPTASISTICGEASPGIEPFRANIFTQKTLSGSFTVKNKYLDEVIKDRCKETGEEPQSLWMSVIENGGSVQHFDWMSDYTKDVFKTAIEIDQRYLVDLAADRQQYICQSQSLNLFLPATVDKKYLNQLHMRAWRKGVKTLYYLRSESTQRAAIVSTDDNDDCLACT